MRNVLIDPFEDIPRPVVVTSNEYPAGFTFPSHAHRRGQFAYASRGTISMSTSEGRWLVPPQRACWVPAGVVHEMTMSGPVTMLNAFISEPETNVAQLPAHCCVYGVSRMLKLLFEEVIDLPALYDTTAHAGKLMALLVSEIARMPCLSLHAPLPEDPRLAHACRRFFEAPSLTVGIDAMASQVGMSRRTFSRHFREQTGTSFGQWRQQVCMLAAIARLSEGHQVTRVALDLGYASPSAFAFTFRRILGETPSQYIASSACCS